MVAQNINLLYKDTKANISALSSLYSGFIAYATDTGEIGIYRNGAWVWTNLYGSQDFISGLRLFYDNTTGMRVKPGAAYIPSLGYVLQSTSDIVKSGLSLSASGVYNVFYYLNGTTPDIEIVTTNPALYFGTARQKSGDSSRRYLGSIRTNASGHIYNFVHTIDDGKITWLAQQDASPFRVLSNGSATTETTVTLSGLLPLTAVKASLHLTNTNGTYLMVLGNSMDSVSMPSGYVNAIGNGKDAYIDFTVDSSIEFTYAMQGAGGGAYIDVVGYTFER